MTLLCYQLTIYVTNYSCRLIIISIRAACRRAKNRDPKRVEGVGNGERVILPRPTRGLGECWECLA